MRENTTEGVLDLHWVDDFVRIWSFCSSSHILKGIDTNPMFVQCTQPVDSTSYGLKIVLRVRHRRVSRLVISVLPVTTPSHHLFLLLVDNGTKRTYLPEKFRCFCSSVS